MSNWTKCILAVAAFTVVFSSVVSASDADDGGPDNYKWRVQGNWWFSHPSGYFGLRGSNSYFDVHQDFGFESYSTFTGRAEYRFRWKHHLLFDISPISNSRTVTAARTIQFQGQTFVLGAQVSGNIKSLNIAPGYQYDIIRRDQGYLGIEADLNLLDTDASLQTVGAANGSLGTRSASKSFFAPLPAVGPTGRWYPLHDSNRLSLEGSVRGMYFFGYGNFLTASGALNVGLTRHLVLRGGYQLGSRLSVHGTSDQIAVRLTQQGPTAGLEYSWGENPVPKPKTHPTTPGEPSNWHVDWVPFYLWFSGLKGTVGAKGYDVPVDASFSDIFSQLNIGLMTVLDVRHKRIGVLTDLLFISVTSDQKSTPVGNVYSGFSANAKTFFVAPEGYWRLLDRERLSIDALGGVRVWHLDNSLNLLSTTVANVTVGQTQGWVDPILGGRFRLNLDKGWFASLLGDAGGFGVGSQVTWQIYGGIGKEFKRRFSMVVGYRYLDVDYQNGGFLYNTHMSGPIAGLNIRLK